VRDSDTFDIGIRHFADEFSGADAQAHAGSLVVQNRGVRNLDEVFQALDKSAFRRRQQLSPKDASYLHDKGLDTVMLHARDFVAQRLAPAQPRNDGKQTPMRGHPAFVAQHATACCCRGCLAKWHGIAQGQALSQAEQAHVLAALERWLRERSA
jgi:predicted Fe-S protein YdhL (DUF1289 family)